MSAGVRRALCHVTCLIFLFSMVYQVLKGHFLLWYEMFAFQDSVSVPVMGPLTEGKTNNLRRNILR